MPEPPKKPLSVSERVRYFESRRSGNIYIIGHGVLLVNIGTVKFKGKVKGKLRKKEDEGATVGIDTGKTGGSYSPVSYKKTSDSSAPTPVSGSMALAKFRVPNGMSIRFYCAHGKKLANDLANLIEGFSVEKPGIGNLVEVINGGGLCYNYRLTYPKELKLRIDPLRARHDVIMLSESRANAYVPLSTILRDPRCQGATIHWLACREAVERRLDGRNERVNDFVIQSYMDAVGGEPVVQFVQTNYQATFTDDRAGLMVGTDDNWIWT